MITSICLILSCIIGLVLFFLLRKESKELELYKTIFPFGEVIDRLSILSIKKKMREGITPEKKQVIQLILPEYIEKIVMKNPFLIGLVMRLLMLNLTQWEMEDRVREEGTAEAALAARENNNLRTGVKNEITKISGGIPEEKFYKGEKSGGTKTN